MGHIQDMTEVQKGNFIADKYEKLKESRRGCSYVYWSERLHTELTNKGYVLYDEFGRNHNSESTSCESEAKAIVMKLRNSDHYARIIAGYEQCQQRIQMYSVFYKSK